MRLSITNVSPGDILNADVYNKFGSLLIPKGHRLTLSDIHRLQQNFILSVDILKSYDEIKTQEQLMEFYKDAVSAIKTIIDKVREGQKIPIDDIRDISLPLVKYMFETPSIPAHLAKIRTADMYTYEHSINVGLLSAALGKWLRLPVEQVLELTTAGLLHDFGKTKVPVEILNKPERLTNDEMAIMQKHVVWGYELIRQAPNLQESIGVTALYHHERMNGSGYPQGLKGPEIPLFSKIVMVADVFDAMTSNRVYRKNSPPFYVFETIFSEQFSLLDPTISQTFLHNIIQTYIGSWVQLSNGQKGEVVFINPATPGRPTVRIENEFLVLTEHPDVIVQELILA